MGKIAIVDHRYIYIDEKGERTLIDCWDCIKNKSVVPIINESEEKIDLLKLVMQIQRNHMQVAAGTREENSYFYIVIDFLVARVLMKSSMPLHVLQLGSMDGILSYHLATMTGTYNPESYLCCVCNGIGNESGNCWLDRIALVENPPKLSMLAADYDDTQLQSANFDLVVVNGAEYFENPYRVLQEAGRLVKKDGAVLCYVYHQPLLADCFRMIFGECEEFGSDMPGNEEQVFWTTNVEQPWSGEDGKLTEQEVIEYLQQIQNGLDQDLGRKELRAYISGIDEYVERAIQQKRVDFKVQLMEMKGRVLDKMYPAG